MRRNDNRTVSDECVDGTVSPPPPQPSSPSSARPAIRLSPRVHTCSTFYVARHWMCAVRSPHNAARKYTSARSATYVLRAAIVGCWASTPLLVFRTKNAIEIIYGIRCCAQFNPHKRIRNKTNPRVIRYETSLPKQKSVWSWPIILNTRSTDANTGHFNNFIDERLLGN